MTPKVARPDRVRLPEELSGNFTGVIIGTFGAELDFAEMQFFRQLPKTVVNRVVLADQRQLSAFIGTRPTLRRLNRAYVACPVSSPHAHHPKYVMLVGPEEGRLFVGSGNLSIGGYAGPGECFTAHEWSASDDSLDPAPFGAVRELIEKIMVAGWIDVVTQDRLRDVFSAAPWVPVTGGSDCVVIHNQERPLLDQLAERLRDETVLEVVAAAPFHDKRADAIRQIVARLDPARLRLLVQEGRTRLDVGALAAALSSVPEVEILEASAPQPYPPVLLHAKLLLVRTRSTDFLLQGSANLSRIALCEAGPNGNVEIANLLQRAPGGFDAILDSLDLRKRPKGLTGFSADDDWGDGGLVEAAILGPLNVTWAPPTLTGQLRHSPKQTIEVRIGERPVVPASQHWESIDGNQHFTFDFSDIDSARIDGARFIELVDGAGEVWTVYPYHVHSLLRLIASGGRAELLHEAGNLDLRDKELEELLAELDRVLVVDGRSLWRLAHPDRSSAESDQESDSSALRYEEIDWERLGELPQMRQYGSAAHRALLAPTELGIILQSLTSRFRMEAGLGASDDTGIDELGDFGIEPESEDPDEVDDTSGGSDDEDEARGRRIAPRQRVRRLWRNFVNRFLRGLDDEQFIRSVGSSVVVPSYVVFNHLCRRLRVVDLVDADFLTEAQTRLWAFMWGDETHDGYLASLSHEEQVIAQQILSEHDDLPATLAAVSDVWWYVWDNDLEVTDLRTVWRRFLESEMWQPAPDVMNQAAKVASRCEESVDKLFDDLYSLAAHVGDGELPRALARCLGVPTVQIREVHGAVMRTGVLSECKIFQVEDHVLTPETARQALALWHQISPDADYLRIQTENATAAIDLRDDSGFFYDRNSATDTPLSLGDRPVPVWEQRLDQLLEVA